MSASLIVPFELEYMKLLQFIGWNSAAVITSVSSSMLTGLISTMSRQGHYRPSVFRILDSSATDVKWLTEALIADPKVPQIHSQVVGRDIRFTIRVDRDRVDMVSMSVGIHLSRNGSNDVLMRNQSRQSELRGCYPRDRSHSRSVSIRHVVLGHDLDLLLEDLPEFDRLVCERGGRGLACSAIRTRRNTDARMTNHWYSAESEPGSAFCTT